MTSRTGLVSMYSSARAVSSIPFETAWRKASMPKVWTEIQIFKARTDRLNCRPRSEKLGCLPPQIVSCSMSWGIRNAVSSVVASFTMRQPAS